MKLYYAPNRFADLGNNHAGVGGLIPYWISDPKTEEEEQENKRTAPDLMEGPEIVETRVVRDEAGNIAFMPVGSPPPTFQAYVAGWNDAFCLTALIFSTIALVNLYRDHNR